MGNHIAWNETYNTGNTIIDNQHKRLVRLINDLEELGLNVDLEASFYGMILTEVENYTRYHFTAEEDIMTQNNYSEIENHKLLHQEFIDKLASYKKEHRENGYRRGTRSDQEFCLYLKNWLVNHIAIEDKKIFKCA